MKDRKNIRFSQIDVNQKSEVFEIDYNILNVTNNSIEEIQSKMTQYINSIGLITDLNGSKLNIVIINVPDNEG